ncbi:hypothetical protein INT45_001700 [Circinella minor]|uniref:Choice-of-anchor A domain-containing protein n=1 Tax=Circinella minor TaxID=1195481 RepID=A0A8H7VDN0_9FUNG|nr:hypothetical protein INT45_001700 [Circinella minor]
MQIRRKIFLTALCTTTLASFSYSGVSNVVVDAISYNPLNDYFDGGYHSILDVLQQGKLYKRELIDIGSQCPVDTATLAGAIGGGTDILGPLAVGGRFTAPNYIVNANRGQDCSLPPTISLDGIGLVVGGVTDTVDTRVHGDSVHAGGGDLSEIRELDYGQGCNIYDDIGTGVMDFDVAENAAIDASIMLASMTPNMYIDSEGRITDLGNGGSSKYKVFTFNTCNDGDCNVGGILSDPSAILFGQGNFNGPTGDVPGFQDTVVFNIPVDNFDVIELRTNFPSNGFYACRTIYNFYPVNSQGVYVTNGEISIFRNTGGQVEGFSLAPRAHIFDSAVGAFAGTIVGLDYQWYYEVIGVEIHDYGAADDSCNNFVGCFPLEDEFIEPTLIITTETTTTDNTVITTVITIPETTITTIIPTISETIYETTETITTGTIYTKKKWNKWNKDEKNDKWDKDDDCDDDDDEWDDEDDEWDDEDDEWDDEDDEWDDDDEWSNDDDEWDNKWNKNNKKKKGNWKDNNEKNWDDDDKDWKKSKMKYI